MLIAANVHVVHAGGGNGPRSPPSPPLLFPFSPALSYKEPQQNKADL